MKNLFVVLACGLMSAPVALADDARTAPDWQLPTVDGDIVRLSEVTAERPTIILFWATWCPYCKGLMPYLQEIQDDYGERVQVLAVHFRDDNGDAVAFMKKNGYDFTLLTNGEPVAKLNQVWGTPGVLLVNSDMQLHFNLYDVPKLKFDGELSHSQKAAQLAPYWSTQLRSALDRVLSD